MTGSLARIFPTYQDPGIDVGRPAGNRDVVGDRVPDVRPGEHALGVDGVEAHKHRHQATNAVAGIYSATQRSLRRK